MGKLRDNWKAAKKKANADDMEKVLKFKDDFGPTLDDIESGVNEIVSKLKDAQKKIDDLGKAVNSIVRTKKAYQAKVAEAKKQNAIDAKAADVLLTALDELLEDAAGHHVSRVSSLCSSLETDADNMEKKLR